MAPWRPTLGVTPGFHPMAAESWAVAPVGPAWGARAPAVAFHNCLLVGSRHKIGSLPPDSTNISHKKHSKKHFVVTFAPSSIPILWSHSGFSLVVAPKVCFATSSDRGPRHRADLLLQSLHRWEQLDSSHRWRTASSASSATCPRGHGGHLVTSRMGGGQRSSNWKGLLLQSKHWGNKVGTSLGTAEVILFWMWTWEKFGLDFRLPKNCDSELSCGSYASAVPSMANVPAMANVKAIEMSR